MDPALLLVAGLALILLLQFSRVRRQQREVRATQAAVEVGAEVLTASGMIGTVVETTGTTITLAGPDGQRSRWVSGAVVRVIPETDPVSSRYRDPAGAPEASLDADGPDDPDAPAAPQPEGTGDGTTDGTTDARGDAAPGTTGSTRQD